MPIFFFNSLEFSRDNLFELLFVNLPPLLHKFSNSTPLLND